MLWVRKVLFTICFPVENSEHLVCCLLPFCHDMYAAYTAILLSLKIYHSHLCKSREERKHVAGMSMSVYISQWFTLINTPNGGRGE